MDFGNQARRDYLADQKEEIPSQLEDFASISPFKYDVSWKPLASQDVKLTASFCFANGTEGAGCLQAEERPSRGQEAACVPGIDVVQQVGTFGAVGSMNLPLSWTEGGEDADIAGGGRSKSYFVDGEKNVELTFFERGRPFEGESAAFKQLLGGAYHELTAAEKLSIAAILGNYGDDRAFKMAGCRIESLKGKDVIVIEGTWKVSGHRSYSVVLNPNGRGSDVQEIFFKAPSLQYQKYLSDVKESLGTVKWK